MVGLWIISLMMTLRHLNLKFQLGPKRFIKLLCAIDGHMCDTIGLDGILID